MEADQRERLSSALERAHRRSTTSGGWPRHLSEAQQDAWTAMVEIEAILTGSVRTKLAGGSIDRRLVRESLERLGGPEVRLWAQDEVADWTAIAQQLLELR